MGGIVTSAVYKELVQGDIDWLLRMPRTLERVHIHEILKWHIEHAASVILYEHNRRMIHESSPKWNLAIEVSQNHRAGE